MIINIAYIIDTIETPNAGTEKQLLMLIENLDRRRFSPHLICIKGSEWLRKWEPSCPVLILELESFKSLKIFRAFIAFKRYCHKYNISIVQTFFRDGNIFGSLAAYFSGINTILSSRRNYGYGYWHNTYNIRMLRALRFITASYIANSKTTADYTIATEKVRKEKVHVIYNGLDLEKVKRIPLNTRESVRGALGIKPDEILIGITANLRPVKNLPLFVRVAEITHKRYPNTRFLVVGEGPEREKLEEMVARYNLNGRVIFAGQQDEILPFISAMDIGVLCSRSESLSNSITEYMAVGLPCVVSDVGGNLEAIGNRRECTFKNDDDQDFVAKLEVLITDKTLRRTIGEAAKGYAVANYDHRSVIRKYQKLYCRYYLSTTKGKGC